MAFQACVWPGYGPSDLLFINEGERLVTPPSPILVRLKPKMTSTNYTLYLQQSAGNYEDSEESDFSQESEVSSQGTESPQVEETENLEPWSRVFDEAENRHKTQLNALINQYQENGDSENMARSKAMNALVLVYRKELRKVLLENLQ